MHSIDPALIKPTRLKTFKFHLTVDSGRLSSLQRFRTCHEYVLFRYSVEASFLNITFCTYESFSEARRIKAFLRSVEGSCVKFDFSLANEKAYTFQTPPSAGDIACLLLLFKYSGQNTLPSDLSMINN